MTALATVLGLGGLAISLAAKDTIADAIAGFIVLVDQPYRIGDRIEIQELGTWGDVTDIGLPTTRIRTPDNRMVIVPNSTIAQKHEQEPTRACFEYGPANNLRHVGTNGRCLNV